MRCLNFRSACLVLAAIIAATFSIRFASGEEWDKDADGDWSESANWLPASVPNGQGASAEFLDAISAPRTISQDVVGLTVGTMVFDNKFGYTVAGPERIMIDRGGNAEIRVSASNGDAAHAISTGIVLVDFVDVVTTGGIPFTLSGVIEGNAGITKAGFGDLVLSGPDSNTYVRSTAVIQGRLLLNKDSGSIAVGADLQIGPATVLLQQQEQIADTSEVSLDIGAGTFDLNGFNETIGGLSMFGGGAKTITTGGARLILQGNVTQSSASTITTFTGTLNLAGGTRTFNIGTAGGRMDILGTIQNGGLTKTGAATLAFGGSTSNSYAGLTTVNGGTLELNKSGGATAINGDLAIGAGTVRLFASNQIDNTSDVTITAAGGLLNLAGNSNTIATLTITGGNVTTGAGVLTLGGNVTTNAAASAAMISGNLNLGAAPCTLAVDDGTAAIDLDIPAAVANGRIIKTGTGTLRLSSANPFAGGLGVADGTVAFGDDQAAGTAEMELGEATIRADGAPRTLSNPVSITGLNTNIGGDVDLTLSGSVSLPGNRILSVSNTALTTLTGSIGETAAGHSLTKAGDGTVVFGGATANTYSGTTIVTGGTVRLAKTVDNVAIPGDLTIGDFVSGPDVVQLGAANQIADTGDILINTAGVLDLNSFSETIGPLTFSGGSLNKTMPGLVRLTSDITSLASGTTAMMTGGGNITMQNVPRAIIVADGATPNGIDLDIACRLGGGALSKEGPGVLQFSGSDVNVVTDSPLTVREGTVMLANSGVEMAIRADLTIGDGIGLDIVRLAAPHQIISNFTFDVRINESGLLDLNGFNDTIGNLNLFGGTVTTGVGQLGIVSSAFLTSFASSQTATIDGHMVAGGVGPITVHDGPPDVDLDVPAVLQGGAFAGFTKVGAGAMRLSAANDFQFLSIIREGKLLIANDAAFSTSTLQLDGGTIQADGAPRTVSNDVEITDTSSVDGPLDLTLTGNVDGVQPATLNKFGTGTLTIAGPQSYVAGSVLQVFDGVLNSNTNPGVPAASPATATLRIIVSGGVYNFNADHDIAQLIVNTEDAKAVINYQTDAEHKVRIYDGGTANGALVGPNAIQNAWNDITSGYNGGTWDGFGTGTTQVTDPNVNGLGLVLETDVEGAQYLGIREMIIGDVNGDDFVDAGDAATLFSNLGLDGSWLDGDANYDSFIDAGDASTLFSALGQSYDPGFSPVAVPEPAAIWLAALAGLGALGVKRFRKRVACPRHR